MENIVDLFTPIHKGIRALIYSTGTRLQKVDFSVQNDGNAMLSELENMLALLEDHAYHEDNLIFPRIENRAPGISDDFESQHREGELKLAKLLELIEEMKSADSDSRVQRSKMLSIYFTDFISFYLWHMNREEEILLPFSQKLLSNEELAMIRAEIQRSIPPDGYRQWLRWMLSSFSIRELSNFYQQARQNAPAPVFTLIQDIGKEYIDKWSEIELT